MASPRTHRSPRHTDQCIRDAAAYGFCAHTVLPIKPPPPPSRLQRAIRSSLRWLAFALLVVLFVALFLAVGWWALLFEAGTGLAWLLIFTLGLPPSLTADLSTVLPPDTRERLAAAPAPPDTTEGPGRHRRSGPSHPS
jgi:hypothetical protein